MYPNSRQVHQLKRSAEADRPPWDASRSFALKGRRESEPANSPKPISRNGAK
jgi:hypothetical protein